MRRGVLLMLFALMIIAGCSSQASTANQPFGVEGYEKGNHVFFLFTSPH